MASDLSFVKGAITVELDASEVTEELSNKLITLSLATTSTNASSGAKDTKIIDLLRITHQYIIRAYVTASATKTAKQVKDELKSIVNGAGVNGGDITMSYDGEIDITGYIEKVTFKKTASDSPSTEAIDEIKYEVAINFIVGTGNI